MSSITDSNYFDDKVRFARADIGVKSTIDGLQLRGDVLEAVGGTLNVVDKRIESVDEYTTRATIVFERDASAELGNVYVRMTFSVVGNEIEEVFLTNGTDIASVEAGIEQGSS